MREDVDKLGAKWLQQWLAKSKRRWTIIEKVGRPTWCAQICFNLLSLFFVTMMCDLGHAQLILHLLHILISCFFCFSSCWLLHSYLLSSLELLNFLAECLLEDQIFLPSAPFLITFRAPFGQHSFVGWEKIKRMNKTQEARRLIVNRDRFNSTTSTHLLHHKLPFPLVTR